MPAKHAEIDMPIISATASNAQPISWQEQWRNAITSPSELLQILQLNEEAIQLSKSAMDAFPLRVTHSFLSRMQRGDVNDPLLRQVLPLTLEDQTPIGFSFDAVGDLKSRETPGLLHKYQGRALLIATGSCAINCRYCFRRHFPYSEETAATKRWQKAIDYLREHTDVSELLLSGGDPWSLATPKLKQLTDQLLDLTHIRRLRIHTRLPIALPDRIDADLCSWIRQLHLPLVVVIHSNHAQELNNEVHAALEKLHELGVTVLNQTVLLKGINDNAEVLTKLSERLFELRVLPYYLHALDRVTGTAHFEVTDQQARDLHEAIRAKLPGYLVPKLVREIPGSTSKTPL